MLDNNKKQIFLTFLALLISGVSLAIALFVLFQVQEVSRTLSNSLEEASYIRPSAEVEIPEEQVILQPEESVPGETEETSLPREEPIPPPQVEGITP